MNTRILIAAMRRAKALASLGVKATKNRGFSLKQSRRKIKIKIGVWYAC